MEFHGEAFFLVSEAFIPANKFLLFNVYLKIYFRTQTSFDFVCRTNLKRLKFIVFFGIWFGRHHLYWTIHSQKIYLFNEKIAYANYNGRRCKKKMKRKRIFENRCFIVGENKI